MRYSVDGLGFPLLDVRGVPSLQSIAGGRSISGISMLPVTKLQFERFLCEPNGYGTKWYDEVLSLNGRVSWRSASGALEGYFLNGLWPEEALDYLGWLDDGHDLPSSQEWRAAEAFLMKEPFQLPQLKGLDLAAPAVAIMERIVRERKPATLGEACLFRRGFLEWVRHERAFAGLGSPDSRFHPNTWNPQRDDPIRPLKKDQRIPYFGFRAMSFSEAQDRQGDSYWH